MRFLGVRYIEPDDDDNNNAAAAVALCAAP